MKVLFVIIGGWLLVGSVVNAGERATPYEVYVKVKEAFYFLEEVGESGIAVFNDSKGQFSWKNAYVFVVDCGRMEILAHPKSKKLRGSSIKYSKGKKGKYVFREICEKSDSIFGEWSEFWWTVKGRKKPSRRIMYMKTVPKLNVQVVSSIYNHKLSLNELRRIRAAK